MTQVSDVAPGPLVYERVLISRLSSRVTKKYGAGGRILFHNFYFPKEKLLMAILFLSTKARGVISCS
jgi:hypothetical protein